MPLEIKTGRYRTRDGRIAIVTDVVISDRDELPFEGYFPDAHLRTPQYWYKEGRWDRFGISGNDLVEWIGPLEQPLGEVLPDLKQKPPEPETVAKPEQTTLRDQFAMAALMGLAEQIFMSAYKEGHTPEFAGETLAGMAYKISDEMLKARRA